MLKQKRFKKSESGMAVIEIIPILVMFILLVNFMLGFFGAIHTAILGSIAARNYAFDTFRNRPNLIYFRDNNDLGSKDIAFDKQQNRIHRTVSENTKGDERFIASARRIDFLGEAEDEGKSANNHNNLIMTVTEGKRFQTKAEGVNPIWIRPSYGICINSNCGD